MPRWNYVSRNSSKIKKTGFEMQQERIQTFLDLIFERKEIRELDAIRILQWGPGIYGRIKTDILGYYDDEVKWNKKKKTWSHIPISKEMPIAEQLEKISHVIKND